MLDPAVHRAEQRQDPVPRRSRALERVLALAVGLLLELCAQRARGEGLRVAGVVDRQEAPLVGDEQEHQPHHHGHRSAVHLGLLESREQLAVALAVLVVERGDEELDGAADLAAELVGHLLLLARALREQRCQSLLYRQGEEPSGPE